MSTSLFTYWCLPKNLKLKSYAAKLRKAGVLSEVIFWQVFNNKKLLKYDIDRQVVIGNYIVDFFIPELGLVFEIDGQSHDFKGQYDEIRDIYLKNLDLEVIHFTDLEVKTAIASVSDRVIVAISRRKQFLIDRKEGLVLG